MIYKTPKVLAESFLLMAECRPNSKPSGRPCNPPRPGGAEYRPPTPEQIERERLRKGEELQIDEDAKTEKITKLVTDFVITLIKEIDKK